MKKIFTFILLLSVLCTFAIAQTENNNQGQRQRSRQGQRWNRENNQGQRGQRGQGFQGRRQGPQNGFGFQRMIFGIPQEDYKALNLTEEQEAKVKELQKAFNEKYNPMMGQRNPGVQRGPRGERGQRGQRGQNPKAGVNPPQPNDENQMPEPPDNIIHPAPTDGNDNPEAPKAERPKMPTQEEMAKLMAERQTAEKQLIKDFKAILTPEQLAQYDKAYQAQLDKQKEAFTKQLEGMKDIINLTEDQQKQIDKLLKEFDGDQNKFNEEYYKILTDEQKQAIMNYQRQMMENMQGQRGNSNRKNNAPQRPQASNR